MLRNIQRICEVICIALLLTCAFSAVCPAQENRVGQTAGVDNTKMGAYRALAEFTYQQFKKGDYPTAAKLARILERTWDQGEGSGGPRSLGELNQNQFAETDRAMDKFIQPILEYASQTPDAASVEVAYKVYVEKLNHVDYGAAGVPAATPQAMTLPASVLQGFVGKYQPVSSGDAPAGNVVRSRPLEVGLNPQGLWIDLGMNSGQKQSLTAISSTEFFLQERPSIHITFIKDEHGQIKGMTITGFDNVKREASKLP